MSAPLDENEPAAHAAQTAAVDAPTAALDVPGLQGVHAAAEAAPSTLLHDPDGHGVTGAVPPVQKLPSGQRLPAASTHPAAHANPGAAVAATHDALDVAPGDALYAPDGQRVGAADAPGQKDPEGQRTPLEESEPE